MPTLLAKYLQGCQIWWRYLNELLRLKIFNMAVLTLNFDLYSQKDKSCSCWIFVPNFLSIGLVHVRYHNEPTNTRCHNGSSSNTESMLTVLSSWQSCCDEFSDFSRNRVPGPVPKCITRFQIRAIDTRFCTHYWWKMQFWPVFVSPYVMILTVDFPLFATIVSIFVDVPIHIWSFIYGRSVWKKT